MNEQTVAMRLLDGAAVTLTVKQGWINVCTSVQPTKVDPDWTWIDPAGHTHDARLKKAVWKIVRVWWCEDCRDEHEDHELVCRYCSAKVKPRYVPDYDQPTHIPGLKEATLDVDRDGVRSTYIVASELLESVPVTEDGFADWVARAENDEYLIAREVTSVFSG